MRGCLVCGLSPSLPCSAQLHGPHPQDTVGLGQPHCPQSMEGLSSRIWSLCRPPASQGAGHVCLAWCTATCLWTAPGLVPDIISAVLPEKPGVIPKRMRTGRISHLPCIMVHFLSCAAIYKTHRAEELTLCETKIAKRPNSFHLYSFQLKFLWLWSLLLSCGYTTLTLGSLWR